MTDDAELRTREDAMLARAAELCLSAAEHLHAEMLAAEPQAKPALTKAMHTALRSLRQCVALRRQARRDNLKDEKALAEARQTARKAQVREAIARLVWNEYEYEPAEVDGIMVDLELYLLADDFPDDVPIEEQVQRLIRRLDLQPFLKDDADTPSGDGDPGFDAAPDPAAGDTS
jgi:hypothetical protein